MVGTLNAGDGGDRGDRGDAPAKRKKKILMGNQRKIHFGEQWNPMAAKENGNS